MSPIGGHSATGSINRQLHGGSAEHAVTRNAVTACGCGVFIGIRIRGGDGNRQSVVIEDGAGLRRLGDAERSAERGAGDGSEGHGEGFVDLISAVMGDEHGDGLRFSSAREAKAAVVVHVVAASQCAAVIGRVGEREASLDRIAQGGAEREGGGGTAGAFVFFRSHFGEGNDAGVAVGNVGAVSDGRPKGHFGITGGKAGQRERNGLCGFDSVFIQDSHVNVSSGISSQNRHATAQGSEVGAAGGSAADGVTDHAIHGGCCCLGDTEEDVGRHGGFDAVGDLREGDGGTVIISDVHGCCDSGSEADVGITGAEAIQCGDDRLSGFDEVLVDHGDTDVSGGLTSGDGDAAA